MGKKKTTNLNVVLLPEIIQDITILLSQYKVTADVIIQVGVSQTRIKPMGTMANGQWTEKQCPKCHNARMRTDNFVTWCSGIFCDYIE